MMQQAKLLELSRILFNASLLQIECQEKAYMKGIEELRYVYHGVAVEIENTLLGQDNEDWRELIESRIRRAFGNDSYARDFMERARRQET